MSNHPGRHRSISENRNTILQWIPILLMALTVSIAGAIPAAAASLTVNYPNGGETLYRGATYNITWTSSGVTGDVAIDIYSGTTNLQRYNVPNTGSYSWTIPFSIPAGASYRIGLSAMSGTVSDFSNAYFTIATPTITITSPNGGEIWDRGSSHTITWTSVGVTGNVLIQLYQNGVASGTTAWSVSNSGNFTWSNISDPGSTLSKIGISAYAGQVYDFSNNNFTIQPPVPTVSVPNGGESWTVGSTQRTTWANSGGYTSFNLELSRNGGSSWETIESGLPGTYTYRDWTVAGSASTNCRMRVTGLYQGSSRNDMSNSAFSIVALTPTLTVTYPNGGETLHRGHTYTITWSSANVTGDVAIDIYSGATNLQRYNVANTGSYSWTIPFSIPAGASYRVSVSGMGGTVWDFSNAYFTIDTPSITVTSANGGEVWDLGSTHTVTWTSTNILGNVLIQPWQNGTASPTTAWTVPNTGSFSWSNISVPGSTHWKIGISAFSGQVSDFSNSEFTIQPLVPTVTAPNGGETWAVGSVQRINWTNPGGYTGFNLELSRNGGSSWEALESGLPGDFTYRDWTVAGSASTNCRVRVTGLYEGGSRNDISNSAFNIAQTGLTVGWPNGGEVLHRGWTYTITWTSNLVTGDVAIDILAGTEGLQRYNVPNTGSFTWTVPFTIPNGTNYRIGLSAMSGTVWDYSDNYFTIDSPTLTLTSPVGGEVWDQGTAHTITWTSQYVTGGILIQPYLDGVEQTVLTVDTPNDGSYSWTIPAEYADSGRYKIGISAMEGHVSDFSGFFTIGSAPQAVYPAAAFYSQRDPAWSGQQLGGCVDTIGQSGCAITCVAMLMAWESGSGSDPNPPQLNTWLTQHGGYSSGCYLNWEIAEDYDLENTGLEFAGSVPGVPDQWSYIDNELDAASFRPVMVEVDGTPATSAWVQHFVVVYARSGASGDPHSYLILDPLQMSFDPLNPRTLATYTRSSDGVTFDGVRKWTGTFPMTAPSLELTSPLGGEGWVRGETRIITWTSSDITGNIQIQPYLGEQELTNIAGGAPNTGSYVWTIPSDYVPANDYRISISAMGGQVWDFSGYFSIHAPSGVAEELPKQVTLYAPAPNPFNPRTEIRFALPSAGNATVEVLDLMGRSVRKLAEGRMERGFYVVTWDGIDAGGRGVSSGVYLIRLTTSDGSRVQKAMLMK